MADATTLETRLDEAETALHRLMTGARVEELDSPSGKVKYTPATMGELKRYIGWLKQQIEAATRGSRRPVFFEFGR